MESDFFHRLSDRLSDVIFIRGLYCSFKVSRKSCVDENWERKQFNVRVNQPALTIT